MTARSRLRLVHPGLDDLDPSRRDRYLDRALAELQARVAGAVEIQRESPAVHAGDRTRRPEPRTEPGGTGLDRRTGADS